ncbi:MAG: hypothetical protein AB8H86_23630 [Polyangiales bacterium]
MSDDPRFIAWELGARAARAEGAEQDTLFEAMFDAYEAIADSPMDPGNDDGPFCAVVRHLSLEQTRRALRLLKRMAPYPWVYRLGGSRAALIGRLAALGQEDEARAELRHFDGADPFAPHWLAVAHGHLVAHGSGSPRERMDAVPELDDEARFRVLDTAFVALAKEPKRDIEEWTAEAKRLHSPRLRELALGYLADLWTE